MQSPLNLFWVTFAPKPLEPGGITGLPEDFQLRMTKITRSIL